MQLWSLKGKKVIFRLKVGVLLPKKAHIDSKMDNINRFLKIQGSISNVRGTDVYSLRRPIIFPQTVIEETCVLNRIRFLLMTGPSVSTPL